MSVLYYPKANVMAKRDTANVAYEEVVLSLNPNTVLYFDSGSGLNAISASVIMLTASWAQNAIAVTSSYSLFAETASYIPDLYPNISSSWASASISASYAETAISASYATSADTATYATTAGSSSWSPAPSSSTVDSPNIPSGLVAYYDFNGNSKDSTYYHHDGYDYNITYDNINTIGKVGRGGGFLLPTASYIRILNEIPSNIWTYEHSIAFWIYYVDFPATTIIFTAGNALEGISVETVMNGSSIQVATAAPAIQTTSSLVTGSWTHVVFTRGTGVGKPRIYINGVNDPLQNSASVSTASIIIADTARQAFGLERLSSVPNITGSIDEFGVWCRELTAAEVLYLYNSGSGRTY